MSNQILNFLIQIEQNNNKEWFEAHRNEYESARNELITIVEELINGIRVFDPAIGQLEAKTCLFRQYRDVRFSKNKLPYKSTMSAYIAPGGKNSNSAGYYIHFEPNKSFIGGGIYAPTPEILLGIRREIYYNVDSFKAILNKKSFVETFGSMMEDKLVRPPKGFPANFHEIDLLKYKHFVVSHTFNPEKMQAVDIQNIALSIFKEMAVFNNFLNHAVKNVLSE